MIEITALEKNYSSLQVLKDINLKIEAGDIFGIVGVSGAGKSTLLRCINGLEHYDRGSLKVDGIEVGALKDEKSLRQFRKNIGMIFQHFALLERLTVAENIAMPMACWKVSKEQQQQKVDQLLALVELDGRKNARPRELSGGQKQRVAIARALAMEPKILLCDEATSALDPNITSAVLNLLRKINQELGITIVMVTHQMSVVKQVCNKMAVLSQGKLAITGEVKEIFLHKPAVLQDFLGAEERINLPAGGICLELVQKQCNEGGSMLAQMVKATGVSYDLVWGKMDQYRDQVLGSFIINIRQQDFPVVEGFLNQRQVDWRLVEHAG